MGAESPLKCPTAPRTSAWSLQVRHMMFVRSGPTHSAGDAPQGIVTDATRLRAGGETKPRVDQLFSDFPEGSKPDSHSDRWADLKTCVCIALACVPARGLAIKTHLEAPVEEKREPRVIPARRSTCSLHWHLFFHNCYSGMEK